MVKVIVSELVVAFLFVCFVDYSIQYKKCFAEGARQKSGNYTINKIDYFYEPIDCGYDVHSTRIHCSA